MRINGTVDIPSQSSTTVPEGTRWRGLCPSSPRIFLVTGVILSSTEPSHSYAVNALLMTKRYNLFANVLKRGSTMPFDKTAYKNLERRFRAQVDRDKAHAIERVVEGWGVYLPCVEPTTQVDYILVGMEPSFNWAKDVRDGEKKVANGARNFGELPTNRKYPLTLLILAMKRYLCHPGETYHMTDVSKGAMPGAVADLDRDRRYEEWYPLLVEEIEIVGKPGGPLIAIGKEVQKFLRRRGLEGKTGRPLYAVQHYSRQASGHWKVEAERDPDGFARFTEVEFTESNGWPTDLSVANRMLFFAYKKQFEAIRARTLQVTD